MSRQTLPNAVKLAERMKKLSEQILEKVDSPEDHEVVFPEVLGLVQEMRRRSNYYLQGGAYKD